MIRGYDAATFRAAVGRGAEVVAALGAAAEVGPVAGAQDSAGGEERGQEGNCGGNPEGEAAEGLVIFEGGAVAILVVVEVTIGVLTLRRFDGEVDADLPRVFVR